MIGNERVDGGVDDDDDDDDDDGIVTLPQKSWWLASRS
jgi:hypothetical protein